MVADSFHDADAVVVADPASGARIDEGVDADAPSGSRRRRGLKRAVRVGGLVVAALAVALCVRTIADQWGDIRHAVTHAAPLTLILAFVASALSMSGLAVLWQRCLHTFGEDQPMARVISWYFAGELGKYLPGGIWPVVGRAELAVRGGSRRQLAYTTTLLSMGFMCIGAAVVCGVLAPFLAVDGDGLGWVLLLLILIPVGVGAVHPRVLGRALAIVTRTRAGTAAIPAPAWSRTLGLVLWSCPTWILVGAASVAVTDALGYDQHPARIAFAAVAAWIVGFLAVPVPAGAGIRELVFVAVCGLDSAPATAGAAIARVLLVLTDGLGGAIGLGLVWRSHRTACARA